MASQIGLKPAISFSFLARLQPFQLFFAGNGLRGVGLKLKVNEQVGLVAASESIGDAQSTAVFRQAAGQIVRYADVKDDAGRIREQVHVHDFWLV